MVISNRRVAYWASALHRRIAFQASGPYGPYMGAPPGPVRALCKRAATKANALHRRAACPAGSPYNHSYSAPRGPCSRTTL